MSNVPPPPAAPTGDNDPADNLPPESPVPPADVPSQPYAPHGATPAEPSAPPAPPYAPPAQPYSPPPTGGAIPGTLPGSTQPTQPYDQPYSQPGSTQQPYGQPGYAQSAYGAPTASKPQTLSLVSMIAGIAGIIFSWVPILGFLASVAAVITGHMAQGREPQAKPFWLTGLITGYVGILMGLLFTFLLLILPIWIFSTVPSSSF
ncbi:DUF4190 domain-containing protein [Salinibacterium sp. ZJ450]|uniref:DUF4190 domain-containing protein n=1 Tax=Salinibacterium sp. ZJ450 TaxID=2708338 RepID=UPI00141FD092|nr:DUF4190 domain-containing protein [Salinibacterium sp. ZJ450]